MSLCDVAYCSVFRAMADAFYGRVPGAQYTNVSGVGEIYTLPCETELNITFVFGGVKIPIHPLDTVTDILDKTDALGNSVCLGAFQPIMPSAQSNSFDMLLGMSFCEFLPLNCCREARMLTF